MNSFDDLYDQQLATLKRLHSQAVTLEARLNDRVANFWECKSEHLFYRLFCLCRRVGLRVIRRHRRIMNLESDFLASSKLVK